MTSLRPLLRSIALDPARPEWQRWRAADAWLNGVADMLNARRELYDALATEPVSLGREALRAHLAAALPSQALSLADIKSVIADFERCQNDNTIMRLFGFRRKLEAEPRPELFDEPAIAWRPAANQRHRTIEVDDLVDHVLAASIRTTQDLRGDRVWQWAVNIRDDEWSGLRQRKLSSDARGTSRLGQREADAQPEEYPPSANSSIAIAISSNFSAKSSASEPWPSTSRSTTPTNSRARQARGSRIMNAVCR